MLIGIIILYSMVLKQQVKVANGPYSLQIQLILQRGREGKSVVFTTIYTRSRCSVLELEALGWLSLLGGFEQAANSAENNSKKFTETLDHWKL